MHRSTGFINSFSCFVSSSRLRLSARDGSVRSLVDINTELAQVRLGQVNLLHQLLVRLGDVVEGQDAPAQAEEEQGTEADEGPEWQLLFCG